MKTNQQIDKVLNSLNGAVRATPGAFFYTRVKSRLQKQDTGFWGSLSGFLTKPAVAFSTLCLIFLLNIAAFFYQKSNATTSTTEQNEQSLSEDYNTTLAANSYYDENTEAH